MGEPVAVGVDVGGTKLLALAVDVEGEVVGRERLTTPREDPDGLLALIAEVAERLAPGRPVGVGIAGIVDRDGTLRYGPNIAISDVPLRRRLADRLKVRVVVANDATVALNGEVRAGAARGFLDVVMLTLGTGVGGGILNDGRLVLGANGMGGELGHVVVDDGGRRCPCGNLGCLEAYASGTAFGARARELLDDRGWDTSLREADVVDGKAVSLAAHEGDELALEVLREAGYWLGVGLVTIVNTLDPALVVVGGGAATTAAPFVLPPADEVMRARVLGGAHRSVPTLVQAQLGDDAGAIGAAALAVDGP